MARCLIIDDSRTIRRGLRLALEREGLFEEILEAKDGAVALELLGPEEVGEAAVDIVLCDVIMPSLDGFGFLEKFKKQPRHMSIPVIMLTGQESVEKKVRALERGASDYLTKPFDPAELIARVKVHLKVKNLQDELREANRQLQQLAVTDPLTELFNRRHFMELLDKEFDRATRHGEQMSLLMADVDHFKQVNDTYGHQVGDRVLSAIARLLQSSLRKHDTIARYGGEEFVVLLPSTARTEAAAVGEKLREAISSHAFASTGNRPVTASIGVACYPDQGVSRVDELIKRADDALYTAKDLGRNRVAMWIGEIGRAAAVAVQV